MTSFVEIYVETRNTFCGTWYLPHSWVHYDRHCHFRKAIDRGYIAFLNAHARTWLISTSGLKSDVAVVFLDLNFLHDAGIPAICERLAQKLAYLCLHGFSGPVWRSKWRFGAKCGKEWCELHRQRTRSYFLGVATSVPLLAKTGKKCDRKGRTDRHTHRDKLNLWCVPRYVL